LASRILVTDLLKEVKSHGDAIEQCKTEREALIADTLQRPRVPADTIDNAAKHGAPDPRAARLVAIKGKGENKPARSDGLAQRKTFLH
jgi:hypothetical protein